MKTSYIERDYPFGQAMLELRTKIGLTQAGLASHLGVSRRAVVEWETGSSYPKTTHLKELIALGVQQKAFSTGHEAEEIRALWQVARQKVRLDERWLSTMLSQQSSPHADTGPPLVEETMIVGTVPCACPPVIAHPEPRPRVDWGDALAVPIFYGREEEQDKLSQWVVQERCRMVSVLGMGGIGKSALVVSTMYRLAKHFEVVIFRSLRDAPSCEELLDSCLQILSPQLLGVISANRQQHISLLLSRLCETRVLLVLDNLECLLQEGDVRGRFRSGFEGYGQLLQRVAETAHQSCLLLTSRENPTQLRLLSIKHPLVHSLRLAGLDVTACRKLLEAKEVVGTEKDVENLISAYGGNPLALKMVAETIIDLFMGEIGPFLAGGTVIFGCITCLLGEQFARLSALEQSVLYWLAIVRESVTLDEIQALLVAPMLRAEVLEAVESLSRRSLIEHGKRPWSFTLQSVVLEYMTAVMIAQAGHEIQQYRLDLLIQYGLSQAHAKEYVRQTQERLLLSPLLTDLQSTYPGIGDSPPVEKQLLVLLDHLRGEANSAQGYGPANLITLLRLQRGHLNSLDLSHFCIRGAYLQGVEMQGTSLHGSLIRDSVFTEAVNATRAVAISLDGKWWAAGSTQGQVRVWDEGSQTLRLIWQAHTDIVHALAFSPDGCTLASGGWDGTVKLWSMETCSQTGASPCPYGPRGTLLWMGKQDCPVSLAFSPDSSLLASGGMDATVRLWDRQSGKNVQTLTHPGHVFAVAFSPDGSLLASGCFDGRIRVWQRQKTLLSTNPLIFPMQTNWVTGLAFAPDSRTLVSANWDRTIMLWEVPDGRLLHTLPRQGDQGSFIAWSPDGRILASYSPDRVIWLWDVEQGGYRVALHGHTADVNSVAFTPDSSCLLSGSTDNTLRVWDVQSGQCVHVITGYTVSLCDIDWSPDGTRLVSGGSDGLVTIWDLSGGRPSRELCGHHWMVYGVGWSPDGRFLASCGWDGIMRLWNPTSGACIHMFQDSSTPLIGMAWNPDGHLLAGGTYQRGIQVWDVTTQSLQWVGQPHLITFRRVAWSPDGRRLVSGGDDGCVYLWESMDGTGQAVGTVPTRLPGHRGRIDCVAWSPDGRRLASCSGKEGSGELFVWDVLTGERTQTIVEHPSTVYAVTWSRNWTGTLQSPCDDQLISGGGDGILRWWDVESGECVRTQAAHQGTIRSLRVSPDGRRLASCGDDGAIMIWDLQSFEHLRTLRCDRPYERLDITGIRGLTEAEIASLRALGAIGEVAPTIEESRSVA